LIDTNARLRAITSGEFTMSTGRNRTTVFSCSHSYSSAVPAAKVVIENPS
jgi:hypothetical protein